MSEKKGKKRPKSYYIKCAHGGKKFKHSNDLDVGMKGFLVTCNKYEKETVREMYNILNEYADKMYGTEKQEKVADSENESEEEDMEKAMLKEAAEMKQTKALVRRFQNTDTKTKNLIFIRTTLEDPSELAHAIFSDVHDTEVQKARYALRVLPVAVTCKANVNQISEKAKELFKKDFETSFGVGLKFTSICKIRNNNSVSRTAILPSLSRIIQEMNPLHSLCHDEPDLVIMVEVIRNICCLSVIKDYFKFKKYNLHEIVKTDTESNDSEHKTKQSKESSNELEKEENKVENLGTDTDLNVSERNIQNPKETSNEGKNEETKAEELEAEILDMSSANDNDNDNQINCIDNGKESNTCSSEKVNEKVVEAGTKLDGPSDENNDIDILNDTENDTKISNECKDIHRDSSVVHQ